MAETYSLVIDAWMREAQEMSIIVEDIETRIKNNHYRLTDYSKSKLFEVGIKLDRLESLLHNPHSKPILTKEDLEFRWNMLSEFRRRTRALALCLYASPSTKRPRDLSAANPEGMSKPTNTNEQDQIKNNFYGDDPEMHRPLISDEATSQSRAQMRQSGSCFIITVLRIVGWIVCLIFGAAVLLFLLIIICSAL